MQKQSRGHRAWRKEGIMEYTQITLNDWMEMKQKLKQELLGVKQSFVRIGYALRKIDDAKLYEQDGYQEHCRVREIRIWP